MATSKIRPEPAIKIINYSCAVSTDFGPRDQLTITAENFGVQPIEGYTPLMIKSFSCSTQWLDIMWVKAATTGKVMRLVTANASSLTENFTVYVSFAWVRNDLIGSI